MKTIYFKNYYGNQAETTIDLPENRQIRILTMKRYNGNLATTVSVSTIEGNHTSHVLFQDFNKTVKSEKVRVTINAVKKQHLDVLNDIDSILLDITEFYAKETA